MVRLLDVERQAKFLEGRIAAQRPPNLALHMESAAGVRVGIRALDDTHDTASDCCGTPGHTHDTSPQCCSPKPPKPRPSPDDTTDTASGCCSAPGHTHDTSPQCCSPKPPTPKPPKPAS